MMPTAVYNANNQLTQWGTTVMTYDTNGNTLNDGMNSYAWDTRNRLVSANNNGAVFSYDPLGRRTGKTILSANTNFLYDGANPVQELNGSTVTANLLTGGVDERFMRTTATETDNYLTDALGSTVVLTDPTGNSTVQYSYAPYGGINISGTTTNSFTYTGREIDGLGINYYRARYYNPTTGRFLSEDPLEFDGGINFYAYVENDPIDFSDPFGLKCITKLMLVTAYTGHGPGSDWPHFAPSKKGGNPTSVGPGTVAVANSNPQPYAYGSSVTVSGVPGYSGTVWDTGAGWDSDHHDVPADDWIDIWLPSRKAANQWGKKWREVTICDDKCKK